MSKTQRVFLYKHKENFKISENYKAGSNLIYDCRGQHFACVSRYDAGQCQQSFKKEKLSKQILFSCRLLKSFSRPENCKESHQDLILKQDVDTFEKLCKNSFKF